MHHLIIRYVAIALVTIAAGCGSGTPSAGTVSTKPMPPEYAILAESIALDMKPSVNEFRELAPTEANVRMRQIAAALGDIRSSDPEISSLASEGRAVINETLNCVDRIQRLPKPTDFVSQIALTAIGGFYTGYTGDPSGIALTLGEAVDSNSKSDALSNEVRLFLVACDKGDACQMMLPSIAKKYAATSSAADGRIIADIDASWGPRGKYDWIKLYNVGPNDLENCTIQVFLTGKAGQTRKNVHFTRTWPANTWMFARYEPGQEILHRTDALRTSVGEIQHAQVSIWSPTYTTTLEYTYQGKEKDRDIELWCQNLRITGEFQPYALGYLWNTERGLTLSLEGMDFIPEFSADVTFRNKSSSKTVVWNYPKWTKGEAKSLTTGKGQLKFDPSHVDISIGFPGSEYRHQTTLKFK